MLSPRAHAALSFSITSGLRRDFRSARGFTRALRAYLNAFRIANPDAQGRVPIKRCVAIAQTLSHAATPRAARMQAAFIESTVAGATRA